jgi:tyrosine-protein kinase Etk/Wzc
VDETKQHISGQEDLLNAVDFAKFGMILKKRWFILVFFLGFTIMTAYFYVRYYKPVYQSSSLIKLNFQSEASILFSNATAKQESEISGEIELLRSRLFFSKVLEAVDLNVSYFKYGRVLDDERFRNSPFVVDYLVKSGSYNRNIDITLIDENTFELKYAGYSQKHRYDTDISTPEYNFRIRKTKHWSNDQLGSYYFRINSQEALVNYLQNSVDVRPESFTAKTLRISLTDHNRTKAQLLVNTIDSIYQIYTKDAKNQTIEQKIAFLDAQIDQTEKVLEEFETYFQDFIVRYRSTNLEADMSKTLIRLEALDSTHLNSRLRLAEAQNLRLMVQSEQPLIISAFTASKYPDAIQKLLTSYQTLVNDKALKLSSYSENSYIIQRIDNELKITSDNLLLNLNAYIDNTNKAIVKTRSQIEVLENSLSRLPTLETQYSKNRRVYAQQEGFMMSLLQAKMQLEITKAGTVTDIVVLSSASFPSEPIRPQKMLIYGLGVVGGIFLSIVFVLVTYLLDDKISGIAELERLVSVPVLGVIPQYRREKLTQSKLVINETSRSALSEALRTIRTNMDFISGKDFNGIVSITSTISGEGKSFIGINLGAIIALSGQKVCLVDLDMRKPKIHLAFGQTNSAQGVSTILAGKSKLTDCLAMSEVKNLAYLPAGPTPPNPSELLGSSEFEKMLQELRKSFDMVILDTPPAGLVTDALLVMKKAGLPLYVVRANYSRRGFAKMIENLRRTGQFNNLSVLFNSHQSKGGYGYGYGYYDDDSANGPISALKSFM